MKLIKGRDNRKITVRIDSQNKVATNQIRLGFMMFGNKLVQDCRRYIIEPPKTGLKHPGLINRSSASGESPAEQSGVLGRSIAYQQRGGNQLIFGSRAEYAPFLEEDLSRPFVSRSVDENENNGEKILENYLKTGLAK